MDTEQKSHRVFIGPYVEKLGNAAFHPVLGVYRDGLAEEVIVHYGEESWADLSGRAEGIEADEFLRQLATAAEDNPEWPVETSDQRPRPNDAAENRPCIRIDWPIRTTAAVDGMDSLLLLW